MTQPRKFGYRYDATRGWALDEEEAKVVRLVFDLYVRQGRSMEVIAGRLPTNLQSTSNSRTWSRANVQTIIGDSEYAGYKETETGFEPSRFPVIISRDLFNEAQQIRLRKTNPSRRPLIKLIDSGLS